MDEEMPIFDPIFQDLHYDFKCDRIEFQGRGFIFNPLTIAMVRPVTVVDKAEALFQNKRFKEAI